MKLNKTKLKKEVEDLKNKPTFVPIPYSQPYPIPYYPPYYYGWQPYVNTPITICSLQDQGNHHQVRPLR